MSSIRPWTSASAPFAVALLASVLGGCSRDEPERPAGNIVQDDVEAPATPTPVPEAAQAPRIPAPDASIQSNAIGELGDDPAVAEDTAPAPDQQMLDDASASGMTARASRDTPPSQEAPADVVEEK